MDIHKTVKLMEIHMIYIGLGEQTKIKVVALHAHRAEVSNWWLAGWMHHMQTTPTLAMSLTPVT